MFFRLIYFLFTEPSELGLGDGDITAETPGPDGQFSATPGPDAEAASATPVAEQNETPQPDDEKGGKSMWC